VFTQVRRKVSHQGVGAIW